MRPGGRTLVGFRTELEDGLAALRERGLLRQRTLPSGLDLSSNDYLGFANDRELGRQIGVRIGELSTTGSWSAPASRLLSGESAIHRTLESRLARFKGAEAALLFPSGWQANAALLGTLVGRADRVVSDASNHASLIDAIRLAGCAKTIFAHLDAAAVERALEVPHAGGRTYLVTESLFSMDGDVAPLDRYAELCERHGALLIVDDAHSTGVFGESRGSGLVEQFGVEDRIVAAVSTFGKALAVQGGCVTGSTLLVETLVNRARPFVFSTALSPLLAVAIEAALDRLEETPERRGTVRALAEGLRAALRARGIALPSSEGPIVPVLVGSSARAVAVAQRVRAEGFDVRAVRPPTVAPGTARLRLSVHADHRADDLDRLAASIAGALAAEPEPG